MKQIRPKAHAARDGRSKKDNWTCVMCRRPVNHKNYAARYPIKVGVWVCLCQFCGKTKTFDKTGAIVDRK